MAQSGYSGSTTQIVKEKAVGEAQKMADKATDTFKSAADGVEDLAGRVMDQGWEVTEGVQNVAGNVKGAIDQSVKDQPMATLAMAAVVGFVLGAIWKS